MGPHNFAWIPLTAEKAQDGCFALCKALYSKLFDYIVRKCNETLYKGSKPLSLGVLDIFGFETFRKNGFDQLLINYTNEKLQTFFDRCIFESEVRIYEREGVPHADVQFETNEVCLAMIEAVPKGVNMGRSMAAMSKKNKGGAPAPGLLAILEEESKLPKGTDQGFLAKLQKAHGPSSGRGRHGQRRERDWHGG